VVIYLQLYLDSTHVSSFGNVKYWGVFLWIGNIPKAGRNDRGGRGRAILIAYLPTVSIFFLKKSDTFILADVLTMFQVVGFEEDSSSKLALHRAEVYHTALGIVFSDLEFPAEHGVTFKFRDTFYSGIPIFMVISADYEEMYVIFSALIA
jgi:hypothetical protein